MRKSWCVHWALLLVALRHQRFQWNSMFVFFVYNADDCTMSRISTIVLRFAYNFWFFGCVLYWTSWFLLLVWTKSIHYFFLVLASIVWQCFCFRWSWSVSQSACVVSGVHASRCIRSLKICIEATATSSSCKPDLPTNSNHVVVILVYMPRLIFQIS